MPSYLTWTSKTKVNVNINMPKPPTPPQITADEFAQALPWIRSVLAFAVFLKIGTMPNGRIDYHYNVADQFITQLDKDLFGSR